MDSYTKLCIVSDAASDGNTTFTDISLSANTVVPVNGVNHSTAYPLFGNTSIEFDGTLDCLGVYASEDWDFGTGDFTLECQVHAVPPSGFAYGRGTFFYITYYHNTGIDSLSTLALRFYTGGVEYFYTSSVGGSTTGYTYIRSTSQIDDGNFHHVALVKVSGVYKLFIDGVSEGTPTTSGTPSSLVDNYDTNSILIGCDYNGVATENNFYGYLEQIRISKGIARYTANFTPPTMSFVVEDIYVGLSSYPAVITSGASIPISIDVSVEPLLASIHTVLTSPIQVSVDISPPLAVVFGAEQTYINCNVEPLRAVISSNTPVPYVLWGDIIPKDVIISAGGTVPIGVNVGISPSKPILGGTFADNNIRLVAPFPVIFGTMEQVQQINCGIEAHAVLNGSMNNESDIDVSISVHAKLQSNVTYNKVSSTITYDKDRRCRL